LTNTAKNIGMEFIDEGSLSKLKLSSKRLKSGKVQVKFQIMGRDSGKSVGEQYGYLLTEPKASLKDVVARILTSYDKGLSLGSQRHLYSVGRQKQATEMLFFK
jgi:hypothetical protein